MREGISGGATPEAFGANNSGIGVGGSTLHWGSFVPRADPRDRRLRTETGHGADWPLEYRDLEPYYDEIEAYLGVWGPANYPWDQRRRYANPAVSRNGPAGAMAAACTSLGVRHADAPAALVSPSFEQEGHVTRHRCVG